MKWGMDAIGKKMKLVIWKENWFADGMAVLESGSPSTEKQTNKTIPSVEKQDGEDGCSQAYQEFCFVIWLLQRRSSRTAKPKIPARIGSLPQMLKVFGYQGYEGPKLYIHGVGLPVSFLDDLNIARGV